MLRMQKENGRLLYLNTVGARTCPYLLCFSKKKQLSSFSEVSTASLNVWLVWILKLISASSLFGFITHSHGKYILSTKILYHYLEVIMADHRRKKGKPLQQK